ncbi:unnamed protein product [Parnassius mnemosyne]|uniref:Alpha-macroglobulin-like TED domain-containing protein n=1 Tax=Parnassius mnemosyne TaxID=213953 RepID=A0AAV1KQA7_9NEOP
MENQKPFLLPRLPYKYDSNNIAATAYALLTCMDHQDNNEPIVMWLNAQRLKDGGWASTQDTYIALRALIEYTNRKRLRDVSALSVAVDAVALHGHTRTLTLRNDNLALMHSIEVSAALHCTHCTPVHCARCVCRCTRCTRWRCGAHAHAHVAQRQPGAHAQHRGERCTHCTPVHCARCVCRCTRCTRWRCGAHAHAHVAQRQPGAHAQHRGERCTPLHSLHSGTLRALRVPVYTLYTVALRGTRARSRCATTTWRSCTA